MSAMPRKPSADPGKTAQDFTALVDAVPQAQSSLDIANTMGIVRTATERLNNWNFARDYSQFFNCQPRKYVL